MVTDGDVSPRGGRAQPISSDSPSIETPSSSPTDSYSFISASPNERQASSSQPQPHIGGSAAGPSRRDGTEGANGHQAFEEVGGTTRLIWTKSKTYIHPDPKYPIPGFLAIVSQDSKYLLAWISEEKLRSSTEDWNSYVRVDADVDGAPREHVAPEYESLLVRPIPAATSDHCFSVPLTSIYSIIAHPPTLQSWHGSLTINQVGGSSLPTLWFHDEESRSTMSERATRVKQLSRPSSSSSVPSLTSTSNSTYSANGSGRDLAASWGGEAVMNQLKNYATVLRSSLDHTLYLIHPSRADVEAHSVTSAFEDLSALAETPYVKRESILHQSLGGIGERRPHGHRSTSSGHYGAGLNPRSASVSGLNRGRNSPAMDDVTFNLFNAFSKITRTARSAAQDVLSHRLARPILPLLPAPVTNFAHARPEWYFQGKEPGGGGGVEGGGFEYDGARVYLAKWAKIVAEEGEKARRAEILSGAPWSKEDSSLGGSFEVLASNFHIEQPKCIRASNQPVDALEWDAWFDQSGKLLLSEVEGRRRIYQRGLVPSARKKVWPFLLGVYAWNSTKEEREALVQANRTQYEAFRKKWTDDAELRATEAFAREYHLIDIDCRRTDRNHPMFAGGEPSPDGQSPTNEHLIRMAGILLTWVLSSEHADSGYGQGMNDFAAPLYVVADGDESLCFAMFSRVMINVASNFSRDGRSIAIQLSQLQQLIMLMDPELWSHLEKADASNMFLCYRWCVVRFRREFPFDDLLRVWDALFASDYGHNFHIFICFAILRQQRDVVIRYLQSMDEILKYINDLSGTLNVDGVLEEADVAAQTFRAIVEKVDSSPSSSPSIRARRDLVTALRPSLYV